MIQKTTLILMSLIMLLGVTSLAQAEVKQVTLRIDGLACPFCAFGLEKKLKKLDGYRSIKVFINEGKVNIGWKEDKPLKISAIHAAVKAAGFTIRNIKGDFVGTIEKEDDQFFLTMESTGQRFYLREASEPLAKDERKPGKSLTKATKKRLKKLASRNKTVTITGYVHDKDGITLGIEELKVQ